MASSFSLVLSASFVALAVRWSITYNSYSGENSPPMFGDYEAQRHWMEVTYHLPIDQWYHNSSNNDLSYWGLDYPPLTAYHSWLCGAISNYINPKWVALHSSHGHQSAEHKLFMRYSVLVADTAVFLPAVMAFVLVAFKGMDSLRKAMAAFIIMVYPGLILIDHGHFQYNCISLGLALWAVVFIFKGRDFLASFFFVLAFNYKQMELYHSLPFFFYLLGICLQKRSWRECVVRLFSLGAVVVCTVLICWVPFLKSMESFRQVIHRIFPFARGLYEDKVANIWCAISVVVKLKQLLPGDWLLRLCSASTLACCLPSGFDLLRRPCPNRFLLSLANCSLAFFLFSYQVHEKSVLLPALPICLMLPWRPLASTWFLIVSVFSMLPLLSRDGQVASYVVLLPLFALLCIAVFRESFRGSYAAVAFSFSCLGVACIHGLSVAVDPPQRLPDLFPVLTSIYCCAHFVSFMVYFNILQLTTGNVRRNAWRPLPSFNLDNRKKCD